MIEYEPAKKIKEDATKFSRYFLKELEKNFKPKKGIEYLIPRLTQEDNNPEKCIIKKYDDIVFITYADFFGVEEGSKVESLLKFYISEFKGAIFLIEYPTNIFDLLYENDYLLKIQNTIYSYFRGRDSMDYIIKITRPIELIKKYGEPFAMFPCDPAIRKMSRQQRDLEILALTLGYLYSFEKNLDEVKDVVYLGGKLHADFMKFVMDKGIFDSHIHVSNLHIEDLGDSLLKYYYWWDSSTPSFPSFF